ncbi:baseplate wedge subunit [Klebsiella phage 0507-KN2-1]|uniref:Gp25 baseplate wedge subunit n=1 Tax=Klebsiella phage 0507-KN2-1 TaxID=2991282 RepID=S6CFA9_BPK05|nr:baseplate wedge subunit [Klebsiella phage 0507-KN2-1]BAN78369.1 putative Gp25 baseplate wedge subunit [Klebsiella phage 0507-KN2-1]
MKDYKDVDLKFGMHPVTKDVTMKSGKWAVLQSVRNIVMSSAGEWRTLPDMGAGLYGMLGENTTPTIQVDVKNKVEDAIALYEPRAEIQSVEVSLSDDYHSLTVTITFNVVNDPEPITDTIWLQRTN